jgi:hypothetical protein
MRWRLAITAVLLAWFSGCTQQPSLSDDFAPCPGTPAQCQPDLTMWKIRNDPDPAYHFVDRSGYLHLPMVYWAGSGSSGWDAGFIQTVQTLRPPFFVDVRAKPDPHYGSWNSIWASPRWDQPGCAEVDISEQLGRYPRDSFASIHNWCSSPHRSVTRQLGCGVVLAQAFHHYWAYVSKIRVDFGVDKIASCATTIRAADVGLSSLDQPYQFRLSTHYQRNSWAGEPNPAASPFLFLVDHIRVWTP